MGANTSLGENSVWLACVPPGAAGVAGSPDRVASCPQAKVANSAKAAAEILIDILILLVFLSEPLRGFGVS